METTAGGGFNIDQENAEAEWCFGLSTVGGEDGESWPTAATPAANRRRSCGLTRVRAQATATGR